MGLARVSSNPIVHANTKPLLWERVPIDVVVLPSARGGGFLPYDVRQGESLPLSHVIGEGESAKGVLDHPGGIDMYVCGPL